MGWGYEPSVFPWGSGVRFFFLRVCVWGSSFWRRREGRGGGGGGEQRRVEVDSVASGTGLYKEPPGGAVPQSAAGGGGSRSGAGAGAERRGPGPRSRRRRASKPARPAMSGEQRGEPQPSTSRARMSLPQKRGWPSLSDLILAAVCSCTARKGASFAFIKKTLATRGYDVVRNGGRLKAAVGALLSKGLLRRVTGSGLAGSFRLGRVGKERVEGAGRRGRAVGGARRRPAGKTKGPRRAVKATAQRLKTRRPRGKPKAAAAAAAAVEAAAAGGGEEVGGPAPAEGES
ncbi:uncharacterized protein LOC142026264 [Buteo buteo]|uniref:uncharacterized protein LOC142026264 n=1 Tax=Buteo buteo TaxID=30397 RepID=UPI003EB83011